MDEVEDEERRVKKHLKRISRTFTFSNLDFDRPNPEGPLQWSTATTHTASQLQVEGWWVRQDDHMGYAMARLSHGFSDGCLEFEIECSLEARSNVRLGVAQILAEAQAPVGYDEYGYGLRISDGVLFHCSRQHISIKTGNVVQVKLNLTEEVQERADWEAAFPPLRLGEYKVKQEMLRGASLSFNGQQAFDSIYRAKYYPAVSLYGKAAVRLVSLYHNQQRLV